MRVIEKAIRDYIKIEMENLVPLEKIEEEIYKVGKKEIQRVREKQLRKWRKIENNKNWKGVI